jgi:y4mF family transcriptional regulator
MLADDDKPMLIRTPSDLGAIIRNRRKQLGLGQAALAQRIEVSRQWIIGIEKGHSRAEFGLVLRALDTLGIRLETHILEPSPDSASAPDLNAILTAARKVEP